VAHVNRQSKADGWVHICFACEPAYDFLRHFTTQSDGAVANCDWGEAAWFESVRVLEGMLLNVFHVVAE